MREPSEEIARRVQAEVAFQERLKTEAAKTATSLIQGYIGPDHKVLSMPNFYSALAQALRQALEQGQLDQSSQALKLVGSERASVSLARNVAAVHALPRVEEREIEVLTCRSNRGGAEKAGRSCALSHRALATGMRRGELLGLQWGDLDLDAGTVRVERSIEETKAGLRVKSPKTKRRRRNITLPWPCFGRIKSSRLKFGSRLAWVTSRPRRGFSARSMAACCRLTEPRLGEGEQGQEAAARALPRSTA